MKKSSCYVLKLFVILVGIIFCVVILSYVISQLSINISGWLSSKEDSSTLINLSVNSILVSVTTIYVLATYGILAKTEESIEQNKINMHMNSKIYNKKVIEDKLEKFYYPLDDLLKSQFKITETHENVNGIRTMVPVMRIRVDFRDTEIKKSSGLADIIYHQYLAEEKTNNLLMGLLSDIYESVSSIDPELISHYNNLTVSVADDINDLKSQFKNI